jgi:uncharacterized membrane protein
MRLATKSAILIALIAGLLAFAKFDHCRTHGWGGSDVYVHACYSDFTALLVDRKLNTHQWPYKDAMNSVEYPPGVAMVMWLSAFAIHHDYKQYRAYFDVNAILVLILLIFLTLLLKRISPDYWYLAPLAPAVISSLYINWDIWAVLPALASIYWFDRKKYEISALALGISIATKFFPIVLLQPASIILWRTKRDLFRFNSITLATWIALNIPFAITTPKGWWRFYKLNLERGADWGSIWHALNIFGFNSKALNSFAALAFIIGAILFIRYLSSVGVHQPLAANAFLIVAIFVTTSKVYSPQYILWLTPLAVIAIRDKKLLTPFWIWQATEMIYHLAIWQYLAIISGAHFGISDRAYALAVIFRIAGLTYFSRELIRAQRSAPTAPLAPQPS